MCQGQSNQYSSDIFHKLIFIKNLYLKIKIENYFDRERKESNRAKNNETQKCHIKQKCQKQLVSQNEIYGHFVTFLNQGFVNNLRVLQLSKFILRVQMCTCMEICFFIKINLRNSMHTS